MLPTHCSSAKAVVFMALMLGCIRKGQEPSLSRWESSVLPCPLEVPMDPSKR